MYFDTHCHLTLCSEPEQDAISVAEHIQEAEKNNIQYILDAGLKPQDFENRYATLKQYPNVLLGVAFAPHYTNDFKKDDLILVESYLKNQQADVLCEIGLDYYYTKENKAQQKIIFEKQLELADQYDVPFFMHIRNAYRDTLEILKANASSAKNFNGAVHCFSGTKEDAKKYLDLGLYLSFPGIITFKNAHELQEVVKYTPMDRILTETDAPYLAPVPHRGKKNRSHYVRYTNEKVASLKNRSNEETNQAIFENCKMIFEKFFNEKKLQK